MINGKYILKGKIKLLSPLSIGNGIEENTDNDVILDSSGQPFIPATSFVGVLRHHIKLKEKKYKDELKSFWGYTEDTKDEGLGSIVKCSDLVCLSQENDIIKIRDGIRINTETGMVDQGAKYDFEIVEKDTQFKLNFEIDYNESNLSFVQQMLSTIISEMENENVTIGAKTNSGLGKIKLIDTEVYHFDFSSRKGEALKWLKQEFTDPLQEIKVEPLKLAGKTFTINAQFDLKNSLIVRSYSEESDLTDAPSIKSGSDYIIPGTSMKGAIRSRAERILNTLGKDPKILKKLFGDAGEGGEEAIKGKIQIDEIILPKFFAEIQRRIKIDRFTGGAMAGALFDSMPLFTDFKQKIKNVKITIRDFCDHEAGLILLVLKDLWTGDLAVGGEKNVGRGVLSGHYAKIEWDNETAVLDNELIKNQKQQIESKLNPFVNALVNDEYKKEESHEKNNNS